MPGGGRGTILTIAAALNEPNPEDNADRIINWIDSGYSVIATPLTLARAANLCNRKDQFMRVWCHALDNGRINDRVDATDEVY